MRKPVLVERLLHTDLDELESALRRYRSEPLLAAGEQRVEVGLPLRAPRSLTCRISVEWEQGERLEGTLGVVASPYAWQPLALRLRLGRSDAVPEWAGRLVARQVLRAVAASLPDRRRLAVVSPAS